MRKTNPPYPAAFRQQMVELFRSGRSAEELAREFEPCAQAIRNWAAKADRDEGVHGFRPVQRDPPDPAGLLEEHF